MGVLDGKVAIVTGASRGLGATIALGFGREGASVVAVGRTQKDLEGVVRQIIEVGGKAIVVRSDITIPEQAQNIADTVLEKFGRIDVLLNNAGITMLTSGAGGTLVSIKDVPYDAWRKILDTNATGVFLCMKAVIPAMISRKVGQIINISSTVVRTPLPGFGPYTASKFAVEGLTKSLALELKEHNIGVNALEIGGMVLTPGSGPPAYKGTKILRAEVILPSALFLASQDGAKITGEHIIGVEWNEKNGYGDVESWSA
ncbi:MAG: SDR family oxidoreductase [Thaumarchaeota archaeon]|nr:SDR family oxidoreductase [Nitrososphaerota archaeon]